jgi:hypothetical protein
MRVIIALAFVVVPIAARPAHADSYIGLSGGLALPLSDEQYTDTVDTSPVLGVRAGSYPKDFGGYLSFEWMPADVKSDGAFGLDVSAHRFRVIVGPEMRHAVSNTLMVTARAGIGLDIAHDSVSGTIFGATVEDSETDLGLGFEFAGGLWFGVGGIQIGGEVSLPVGIHDDDPDENDYNYDYTAVDLQLLAGVRFISH